MDEGGGLLVAAGKGGSLARILGGLGGDGGGGLGVPEPFASRICLVEKTRVAGTTHVEDIDELVADLHVGDELRLVRDADNKHDRWAVKVLDSGGRRLGFLPCDCNEIPARLMDGGKRIGAKVTGIELCGKWHKIALEVYLDD